MCLRLCRYVCMSYSPLWVFPLSGHDCTTYAYLNLTFLCNSWHCLNFKLNLFFFLLSVFMPHIRKLMLSDVIRRTACDSSEDKGKKGVSISSVLVVLVLAEVVMVVVVSLSSRSMKCLMLLKFLRIDSHICICWKPCHGYWSTFLA